MKPSPPYRVFLGFDANELRACNVAKESLLRHTSDVRIDRISRLSLWEHYHRPTTSMPNGQLFDELSGAPMSTDHAIARFFVPFLRRYEGWALFMDGDVLVREDVRQLFSLADPQYAVQVVKHEACVSGSYKTNIMNGDHGVGSDGYLAHSECDECRYILKTRDLTVGTKKAGHIQQAYPRKNWSSVILFNCGHPANNALTLDVLNAWPGRDLHAFRWLTDGLIGSLPMRWNYLVNVSEPQADPALVHFTLGTVDLPGHEHDPFADEWREVAKEAGYKLDLVRSAT